MGPTVVQVPLKCGAIEDVYIIENFNPRTTALNQMRYSCGAHQGLPIIKQTRAPPLSARMNWHLALSPI